ncbi:MAG: L-threonylcarbamoyladenylate synthase [Candidatus Pelagibacter sp.]|jgi:L-threonylcarbamoyladenylate synthase
MKSNQSNIKKAKKYLDSNECIAVPTETVYGLAGNAYSDSTVKKIFKLKKRPANNPLIVHYYNLKGLEEDCIINEDFKKLYNKFSPGPITYVLKLKKNSKISKHVTNNKNTVAIRFPKHPLLRRLLKILNYPLAAPSANISSKLSSVQPSDVREEFGKKLKYILIGGRCSIGVESTIINLTNNLSILRLGGLNVSKIKKILKKQISVKIKSRNKISPGLFSLHYSPGIPLRMNVKKPNKEEAFILIKKRKINSKNYFFLSKNNNLTKAARNLYPLIRKIKNKGYKKIAVEKIPNIGIGQTINDRLERASKY